MYTSKFSILYLHLYQINRVWCIYHLLLSYKITFSYAIMLVSNLTSNEFVQIKISLKHTILYTNAFTFQLRLRLQDVKIKRDEKMKYSLITLSVFSPSLMIGFRKIICHMKWIIRFILWNTQEKLNSLLQKISVEVLPIMLKFL